MMICYCCGESLSSRRYRLHNPSHSGALSMWKQLATDRLGELGVEARLDSVFDSNSDDG